MLIEDGVRLSSRRRNPCRCQDFREIQSTSSSTPYNIVHTPKEPHQTMSRAAKLTLAGTTAAAAGIVVFVHYAQQAEKAVSELLYHCKDMANAPRCKRRCMLE